MDKPITLPVLDHDRILIDWLSFTCLATPEMLKEILSIDGDWQCIKGAHGYKDRYYNDGISIHFNGNNPGSWVEFSGQGCRNFESHSGRTWKEIIGYLISDINACHVTRLDLAYDDVSGILDIDRICRDVLRQNYISPSTCWEVLQSNVGQTCYIGSPSSLVRIRIYNKATERGYDPSLHWIRCEIQLRDERASAFLEKCEDFGSSYAGLLLNYLRFVEPSEDSNKTRWPTTDYWLKFIAGAERIRIYECPGVDYNKANLDNLVYHQLGNAVWTAIKADGLQKFLENVKNRSTRMNPKYLDVLNSLNHKDLVSGHDYLNMPQLQSIQRLPKVPKRCVCWICGDEFSPIYEKGLPLDMITPVAISAAEKPWALCPICLNRLHKISDDFNNGDKNNG